VLVVRGLTRADPTLQIPTSPSSVGRQADVSGAISGASVGPGQVGAVLVGGDALGRGVADISSGTAFAGTHHWFGAATLPVTLFGLVLQADVNHVPTAFQAFGTQTTTLDDGVASAGIDVPLMPVATAHLTGTVTGAFGLAPDQLGAIYAFRDGQRVAASPPVLWPATSPFDVALPDVPAASLTLLATGATTSGDSLRWRAGLGAADHGLDIDLRAPPALSAPTDGAGGVAAQSTFRWSATDASVYLLIVSPDTTGPSLVIVTSKPQATLPDLSAFGLGSTVAGGAYHWHVYTLGRYASVDDAAGPEAVFTSAYRVEVGLGVPTVADGWYVDSETRGFTFAP
jgi:hypothetical protein